MKIEFSSTAHCIVCNHDNSDTYLMVSESFEQGYWCVYGIFNDNWFFTRRNSLESALWLANLLLMEV